MKNLFYICSWKAYLSFNQAREYIVQNKSALATLGKDFQIIICASFDVLSTLSNELKGTGISLGAQDCSAHKAGPYTGQVLATSLKEIGCTYCIIGHSEVRKEYQETTPTIAQKALRLLEQSIIPIICIGESAKEYDLNLGTQVVEQQLEPLLTTIKSHKSLFKTIAIGYEPIWAIGNGGTPSAEYLSTQLEVIKRLLNQHIPEYKTLILYGGSVNETNALKFKNIPLLDGVLIGGASTDFQKLQKIVLS
jgi:triosephosphate isomerase